MISHIGSELFIHSYHFDIWQLIRRQCCGITERLKTIKNFTVSSTDLWKFTHYSRVMPYGDIDMGRHCFRLWLVAWASGVLISLDAQMPEMYFQKLYRMALLVLCIHTFIPLFIFGTNVIQNLYLKRMSPMCRSALQNNEYILFHQPAISQCLC